MILALGQIALGLALLVAGAQFLISGASALAARMGLSPLVIGLTVVAFGTSAPELAVSLGGVLSGQEGVAMGNVIGSNIFNILFILGVAALIAPLVASSQLVRLDVPLMIGASVLVLMLCVDGRLSRLDGSILVAVLVGYLVFLFKQSQDKPTHEDGAERPGVTRSVLLVGAGLGLLVLGSEWMVDGAVVMASRLGVSETVIALTILAAGTSLPEVVTSVVATVRGQVDIAVGNVVGSNVFNLLAVLGITSIAAPIGVDPELVDFELPFMVAVAIACLPIFFTGGVISRWEGLLFVALYGAYMFYLFLSAGPGAGGRVFSDVMLWFVLPLMLMTLVTLAMRERSAAAK